MQTQTSPRHPLIEVHLPDTNGSDFRMYRKAERIAQTLTNLGMLKTYKVPVVYVTGRTVYPASDKVYVDNIEIKKKGTQFLLYGDVHNEQGVRVHLRTLAIDDCNNLRILSVISK